MNIVEIYLQAERYNARICATISPARIAVTEDGDEFPICHGHEAKNASEARSIYETHKHLFR